MGRLTANALRSATPLLKLWSAAGRCLGNGFGNDRLTQKALLHKAIIKASSDSHEAKTLCCMCICYPPCKAHRGPKRKLDFAFVHEGCPCP
eukprot:2495138-Amphidinium_carterae.1